MLQSQPQASVTTPSTIPMERPSLTTTKETDGGHPSTAVKRPRKHIKD